MADTQQPTDGAPPVAPDPAVTPPSPSPGESTAPSPSAPSQDQGETRESLLDVVTKAVEDPRPGQPRQDDTRGVSPAPAEKSDQAAPRTDAQKDDDIPDELTPEEIAAYQHGAKRRVEKLLDQRRELRTQVNAQQQELDRFRAMEPQAQAAASVQQYLRDNDIGRDDFLLTLELAAAMRRGDFKTFYEGVQPYVKLAEEYLGIALPQDLQQRVREGHMTTQAAQMYSRERMDRALAQSQFQQSTQRYNASAQQQAAVNLSNAVQAHVNAWEAATKQSDPDYERLKPLLQDVMWSVVRERGAPQSPEHAVEIAKTAYQRVKGYSASWAPPVRPTSRTPSSTGKFNGAAAEPKSLADVVTQVIERARA